MRAGKRDRKQIPQAEAALRGRRLVSLLGLLQHREIRRPRPAFAAPEVTYGTNGIHTRVD